MPRPIDLQARKSLLQWNTVACFASFALLWVGLIIRLAPEWTSSSEYNYGWVVPPLAAFLFWCRWIRRPAAGPIHHRRGATLLFAGCTIFLLPIFLLVGANPDWRFLSWLLAVCTIVISLSALYLIGGRTWAYYFSYPLAFVLLAVPWPRLIEQAVVQGLMQAIASIDVAIVSALGFACVQHGTVIELTTGYIGVEEACSGLKTLLAMLVVALFLGELSRLNTRRRFWLAAFAVVFALLFNLARAVYLTRTGATQGIDAVRLSHNWVGNITVWSCILAVGSLAFWLSNKEGGPAPAAEVRRRGGSVAPLRPLIIFLIIWILIAETATRVWYRSGLAGAQASWHFELPTQREGVQEMIVGMQAKPAMQYDDAQGETWKDSAGRLWGIYLFRWAPGRAPLESYSPDNFFPGARIPIRFASGPESMSIHETTVPSHFYCLGHGNQPLYVFCCYFMGDSTSDLTSVSGLGEIYWRFKRVWTRQRPKPAHLLAVVVSTTEGEDKAKALLRAETAQIASRL